MKKVISLFLSLVLILSTLSMVDLSAYANENTDEIVGKVDYSNLTQNQYISRILLNYNYLGEANDYNSANEPAEKSELEFWLNPVNVSFARILVDELQANSEFMDSVKGWEVLTFSPGELASDAFKEEDYYTTILLSILDAKVSDNEFIKDINCTTNKTILSITKNTTKFLKELCSIDISDMEDVSIDNLSNTQYNDMLDDMLDTLETSENSKELYDLIGKDIGYISDATKACKSVSDVIKTVSMYSKLAETSKATQQVLYDIYINCPDDNAAMKSAAKKVYEYTSNSLSKEILTLMESGEAVFSFGFDKIINKIWGKVLTAVLGEFGAGLLIGQAVGKSISNFLFSTDAVIDKYYAMNALVKFEDVITKVVTEKGNSYIQNENSNNADSYLRSIELMLATYNLGYDYTKDYLNIVSEKGLINGIKNLFGNNETVDSVQSDIESVKSSVELAYGLVSINTYKFYLEIDVPSLYQVIYGNITSNIPVSEMNIEQKKELNVGDKGPAYDFFSITYGPENYTETILGENVSSSDESIIAVDNSNCIGGYITVVGSGTCTLTFTTYNGKHSNSIEVTVKNGGYEILDEGTAGSNIVWHLYNNGHLEILGFGPMSSYRNGSYTSGHSPWYSYMNDITTITIQEGITSIGNAAFYGCDIDNITIPDSVLTIGAYAFEFCDLLKEIDFGNGVTRIGSNAFYECTSLTNIVLPDSVTTIDSSFNFCENLKSVSFGKGLDSIESLAFQHCALEYLEIPASVTYIDEWAFSYCYNLINISVDKNNQYYSSDEYGVLFNKDKTKLIKYPVGNRREYYAIPDGVVSIEMDAFKGSGGISSIIISGGTITDVEEFEKCSVLKKIIIPNSVQSIGKSAFEYCALLQDITIPKSVTNIGDDAFYGCSGLTSVIIPDSVTSIGNEVFYNCKSLASVTISNSVKSIGERAFYGCTLLTSIIIGNSVTSIGNEVFYNCKSLASVTIPNSVTGIGSFAFYGCTSLSSVTIGNSVKSIGERAFYGCTSLTSIIIGNSVTSIGSSAFYGCISLTSITIDNSVTSIGSSAFNGCTSLTSVTIGNSVKGIGFRAFYDCKSLTSVTIGNGVTTIESRAFELCSSLTDVYYTGSESDWNNIFIGSGNSLTNATIHYNHIHSYNNTDIIIAPTCIEKGAKTYTCIECGAFITELIPATGHNGEIIEKVDPNCVSSGYTKYKCTTCSEVYTENFKALGHNYISTGRKIEPTCTENGIEYFECSTCGEIYERTPLHNITVDSSLCIESDHNYSNNTNRTYDFNYDGATKLTITFSSDTKVENNYDYIYLYDGNGTEIGKYTGTSLANQSFTIDGDSFSVKLTSDSSQTYYGFSFSSIIATVGDETATDLLATGHNYISQVTAPTCTTQGYTMYTCSNCGDSYVSNYIEPSHNYVNGICTVCGYYNSITNGNTIDVDIANAGDIIYVYFTPEVDNSYIFYSTGNYDTYVTLYDENMNCLTSDDESGNNNNFSLYYNFESGKTYIFACRMYSSSATGNFQVTLERHEHSYSSEIVEPTCTSWGYTLYTCSCGDSFSVDDVSPLGHNFVNGVCERCNLAYPELIEVQENEIYNVSFDTSGKSSYYSFTPRKNLDYFIQSNNLLNYVPNCSIRVYDRDLNFIESTYFSNEILWYLNSLEEGKIYIIQFSTYSSFENSGDFQFSINQHEHSYSSEIVEPTCTARGYTRYTCSCGDSFTADYVDALGHNFVDNVCVTCGVKHMAMDIFLNSTYDIEITEGGQVYYLYFTPEADGSYMFYSIGNRDTYVTLYDENMNGLKSDDDSGNDSNFLISYDFEAGKTYIFACKMWSSSATGSFQVTLEQHEHSYSSEIVEPTCTSRGYTRCTCSCGDSFTTDYVDALGHNYVDGTCTCCGKVESDFEFELLDDETIRITEYTGTETDVTVPSSIGEYIVKEVSYSAFDDCDLIQSITFSEGIERIYCICTNCPNLDTINLPSTVNELEESSFANPSNIETVIGNGNNNEDYIIEGMSGNLKNINVSSENPYYCSIDGVLFTKNVDELLRYPSGKETTIYEIPDTVKTFSSLAFAFCGNIEKIIIPASVETINNQMFVLLKCVKMDGYQSISELKSDFKGFEVSSDNTNYCSVDGVLYTKDMNTLIAYPNGKIDKNFVTDNRVNKIGSMAFTYTLVENVQLNNVKRIEDQAFFQSGFLKSVKISENCNYIGNMGFAYCTKLENIVIPNKVTIADEGAFGCCVNLNKVVLPSSIQKIPQMMFIYCMNLSEIYIPKSVTSVDMSAFATSEKLQTVYYEGTEEEWNKINVEEHNEPLLNATVIFNSNPEMIGISNIDADTLTAAIEKFDEFDSVDYSEASYNHLKKVVDKNKGLIDIAQSQEEIDFAVTEILEAIYDLEPYLNFTISSENGSYEVTYDGNTASDNKYSLLFGTEITLSATANDGYEFIGWYDVTNNLYFSKESTYTFKLTENTNLKAVFVKEHSATLTFTTYSNWVQSTVTKTIDEWNNVTSIEDLLPQVPYKYGYSNGRWVYDNDEVLAKLRAGESVFLIPEYDEDDTSLPTPRESENGVPALDLYYKLDADANVGSFVMAVGIPDDCQIESVGVAFYYKKANEFDPTKFELLINNKMLVSRFNTEEIEDIYIVNMNKLTSTYNWAVRGYVTYYDTDGNLKTAYSNQVNIVNREQV